ncbi:hypothetical protein VSDG_07034 [Cytospora chrysosperma]|uniref:CCZ1/INTU/HSP4 first Longin domain-containing protein n=1 Tax=Cytospora chrysosperma TaxID=252740 RepID=A0A423VRT1_CYTCH|nr:hypothetical protein VSDG_07034 [Valsa sordida]
MASSTATGVAPAAIIPAQVGFLAIFNPSLGNTDETLDDQIVYYSSLDTQSLKRRRHRRAKPTENVSQAERNERLRQIGLAQGMVNFAKNFSGDQVVDTIETEKTRVVLHELEPGWWVLACIDLTRLPLPTPKTKDGSSPAERQFEYSSREVKPSCLLLQNLLRAHATFLLHHDSSLSALFLRLKREKFTRTLGRYWDLYVSTWNVLLHGNPVQNIFGGIKIAASGELGIGVGEEERGSGEREVLEGFIGRTEGLVDLVVSKFGSSESDEISKSGEKLKEEGQESDREWLGTTKEPGAEDGAIFLGVGALSRKSIRDITHWMEDIYTWGENAYGVFDSPKANRRPRRESRSAEGHHTAAVTTQQPMHVPPSLIPLRRGSKATGTTPPPKPNNGSPDPGTTPEAPDTTQEYVGGIDKYMEYLKLGYGKYWSLGGESASKVGTPDTASSPEKRDSKGDDSVGHFLIGLTGEVEEGWVEDPEERRFVDHLEQQDPNTRNMVRTLTVELETEATEKTESQISTSLGSQDTELSNKRASMVMKRASFDSQDRNKTQKLRVVVYVIKPFIFTFLFELRTESLEFQGLYRSLHHQIAPLRKSLGNSTAYRPEKPDVGIAASAIYDLVWDPKDITVHSTIPNIPDAAETYNGEGHLPWSRLEALNTHMQVLNVYNAAKADLSELERTCKTSRGWWIVWNRILERRGAVAVSDSVSSLSEDDSSNGSGVNDDLESGEAMASSSVASTIRESRPLSVSKEIILIRKASDHGGHGRSVSLTGVSTGAGWSDGASRLAQGIGVDTRKYIEGLLSMHR